MEGRPVCVVFVRMQIVRSRLDIDEIRVRAKWARGLTEPHKLEINCRTHTDSHYSEAAWPSLNLEPVDKLL